MRSARVRVDFAVASTWPVGGQRRACAAPAPASTSPATPGVCVDYANGFQVSARPERIGFLGRGTYDFSAKVQGYAELGYCADESQTTFPEPFWQPDDPLASTRPPMDSLPSPFNATFAPGAAGNPLSTRTPTYSQAYGRPRHPDTRTSRRTRTGVLGGLEVHASAPGTSTARSAGRRATSSSKSKRAVHRRRHRRLGHPERAADPADARVTTESPVQPQPPVGRTRRRFAHPCSATDPRQPRSPS